MANSWWEEQVPVYSSGYYGYGPAPSTAGIPTYRQAANAPADWGAFRQNYGGGYASEQAYQNWRHGQQRERTLSDFVNRMATESPESARFSSQMQGDYDKYRGNLDAYLAQAAPVASQANRFEAGLAANERRLNALLDDPNAIQQTAAYKFRLGQGQEALQRQLAAKGMLGSGNRLMELTKYGQDMASQEYEAQHNRLAGLVGQYATNWIGDKNANTQRYAAESQAHLGRGKLLSDIYGQAQQGLTSAQKIAGDQRVAWGNLWSNINNKPMQWSEARPGLGPVKWG